MRKISELAQAVIRISIALRSRSEEHRAGIICLDIGFSWLLDFNAAKMMI
jgi:hypothetical protein